jgi:hypothetical protein
MDLADQVEDYICTFEAIGDLEMDSLIMFVFIWALSVLILLWLGKFLYQKYLAKKQAALTGTTSTTTSSSIPVSPTTNVAPISSVAVSSLSSGLGARSGGGGGLGAAPPSRGRAVSIYSSYIINFDSFFIILDQFRFIFHHSCSILLHFSSFLFNSASFFITLVQF